MKLIYIETYGCSANKNNSEIIKGLLKQAGYDICENEKIADILIINSCVVKSKTESKIKRRIQDLLKLYPKKILIVTGCMAKIEKESLKKISNKIYLLGINHITNIVNLIRDLNENKLTKQKQEFYLSERKEEKINLPKIPYNPLISITQISEGCVGECSYCKTRLVKGKLFSYPKEKIIKSIKKDLESKAKEIWITSQDCAAYGLDKNSYLLPQLLEEILSLNYKFKLRIGMMKPDNLYNILDKMIEIYTNPKIYKFLHLPIQSSSNKILEDMNRKYKIEIAEEIIKKFKENFPDFSLAIDLIVGYPTETQEDHKKNLEFIEKYNPNVLNLSKFSSHKKTEAGKLKILSKEIINKRTSELMEVHRKKAKENKEKFLGKILEVFVNSKTKIPNVFEARDINYNIILVNSKDKSIFGKNIKVKITQIGVHHMIGEKI